MKNLSNFLSQMREKRKQKQLEKSQRRDFEKYGIESKEIKVKSGKTNWKALKQSLKFFKPFKLILIFIAFVALVYAILVVFRPVFVEKMFTELGNLNFQTALIFGGFYTAVMIVGHLVMCGWQIMAKRTTNKIVQNMRSDLIQCVFGTKTKKFDTVNSGEVISRINSDTVTIARSSDVIITDIAEFLKAVGFIVYFFLLNFWIGLLLFATVILFTIFDTIVQRYRHRMNRKDRILSDKNIGLVSEIVRAIRDIKVLNAKKNIGAKYEKNINNITTLSDDRIVGVSLFNACKNIMLALLGLAFIVLAIFLFSKNMITLGVFMVFIMYRERALNMIQYLASLRETLKVTSLSAERICEIMDKTDYPKENFGKRKIKNPQGEIRFEDVTFAYNENAPVLENFSLTIPANKTIAFVGKSGHGKSTLISLIPKLYEVNKGKILIDGIDITKLQENSLRDMVAIVPQTPYIFNTTIRENLQLVKSDLTDEEMIAACKIAQIHDFIIAKPDGYDSIVGENGVILSGGQKQRLAIARALLKNSKIILLDEATSALDNESQAKIQKSLENLAGTHTIVIVAHRLSTVMNADQIVMIENGKIVGQGTHKQLLKTCKEYNDLYNQEEN